MKERSFGVIPLRKHEEKWQVLLIRHHAGHWGFPKGRAIENETPLETAKRELKEETGLRVSTLLLQEPLSESYFKVSQGKQQLKSVSYFIALVSGDLSLQEEEISEAGWYFLLEAQQQLDYLESKKLCLQVMDFLAC